MNKVFSFTFSLLVLFSFVQLATPTIFAQACPVNKNCDPTKGDADCQPAGACTNLKCSAINVGAGVCIERPTPNPSQAATTCSSIGTTGCTTDEDCRKPGGACAAAKCQPELRVAGVINTPSTCVTQTTNVVSNVSPTTAPTGTPLASPCTSWSEIDETGKVVPGGENAIPWKAGDPYPTLPEGRRFKCASIDTAIGPIQTDPVKLVQQLFGILLSLAGGIALLLIIYSGYQIMTSEGNPEKLQAARETLTSAIIGLVFLIFSLVILQIIGVDILRIPGFK